MSHQDILIETWTELGIGFLIVATRIIARLKVVGIKKFRADDYLIVLALMLWAACCWLGVAYDNYGSIASLTTDEILELTPEERPGIELGGKIILMGWISYVCFIWITKACLLFYYNSLTNYIWQQKLLVKITSYIIAVTFVTVIVTILAQCSPIENNWRADQVPSYNCQYGDLNWYITYSCHFFTDLLLLAIPIPIIFTLSQTGLSFSRRVVLIFCLCSGIFTVGAAVASFVSNFSSLDDPINGALWGNREQFVWIIFLNIPSIASAFRTEFWSKSSGLELKPETRKWNIRNMLTPTFLTRETSRDKRHSEVTVA